MKCKQLMKIFLLERKKRTSVRFNYYLFIIDCVRSSHAYKIKFYICYYVRTCITNILDKRNLDNHMGNYTSYIFDVY